MSHYLLSVVTPTDGTPPAAEELDTIMKNVDTLHREMRDAGAWVFSGGLDSPDAAIIIDVSLDEGRDRDNRLQEDVADPAGIQRVAGSGWIAIRGGSLLRGGTCGRWQRR